MRQKLNKNLGYVTQITEKIMLAVIAIMTLVAAGIDVWGMIWATRNIQLADLFLLFIYTEIVGMVGAYYISNRIPVTLPIIFPLKVPVGLISPPIVRSPLIVPSPITWRGEDGVVIPIPSEPPTPVSVINLVLLTPLCQ